LELLLPTFLLLQRFSLQHSSKIRILLDHQYNGRFGTNETLHSLLGALSPHTEVLPLQNYLEEVSRQNPSKRFICFEQFLFGTKQTAPTFYHDTNSVDLHPGDLQSFRDYILTSNSIVSQDHNDSTRTHQKAALAPTPTVEEKWKDRIFLVEQRQGNRKILNSREFEEVFRKIFPRSHLKWVSFAGLPFLQQVEMVANAHVLVTVAGTASHHIIWLRDGGTSIEILHPIRKQDVNLYLRKKLSETMTITLHNATHPPLTSHKESEMENVNIYVDIHEWEEALRVISLRR
jgi:hypothetical protein